MAGDTLKLRLVNHSHDTSNSEYVVFQKNVGEISGEKAIAWRVIQDLGPREFHPFDFPPQFEVSAGDAMGNYTELQTSETGDVWVFVNPPSGHVLQKSDQAPGNSSEVEILNGQEEGSMSANIYRDGKLLAAKTAIPPGQKAVFELEPQIWISAVPQAVESEVVSATVLQSATEIDLSDVIAHADIEITGGGSGPNATPFNFRLINVNKPKLPG